MIVNLTAIPYGNARVRIDTPNNCISLQSYDTTVAAIEDDWLTIFGLYSMTTRKHIGAFCKEYANCDYQTAKTLYEGGVKMNIYTGEVLPL